MMNRAKMMSEQAINKIDAGSNTVFEYMGATTVVVGKDKNGYWIADNGEEIGGLTREEACRLAEEAISKTPEYQAEQRRLWEEGLRRSGLTYYTTHGRV